MRREREASLAASLRADEAAAAAAARSPVVPSTADAVMYAARLEATLASRDADAATLRAAVAALADERGREAAVRWTLEAPRAERPANAARMRGARGGDRAEAAGGGPGGDGGGRGGSTPAAIRALSSLRLSSTGGVGGSRRGGEERAARREERRHSLGTAVPGGRGRRRLGEVLFSSASGGVLGGADGGNACRVPAVSASAVAEPASPPCTPLASTPLFPLRPLSARPRTPRRGGQAGNRSGDGRSSSVGRGDDSSGGSRTSDDGHDSHYYDTSGRRTDRTHRGGSDYPYSENRTRSGGSGYVQVPMSSDDDGDTPYTWRAGDTTGRSRETGLTPGTPSSPSVNSGGRGVGPRRLFHRRPARMRAAPAARLGPLRRPSLVAVAVLLTLTVPLAVVRLAVDGDDPGMGVRGVGDTIRQASAHMLNSWSPVSLPALPSLSALSALADRSMSAAASAGGAIVGRTTRAGAGSPSVQGALPPPVTGSLGADGGGGGGGGAAAAGPLPPLAVPPTDTKGGAWPVDTAGEVQEVDPPADGIVSLASLLSGRFSTLLAPALLSRAPWLFPPVPCSRPRLALRLGDEDHPLPGTLRLLRSCEGPPAANGGGCEPDLSAHIPDMRRVHVALPLPAAPPGLLTVYPSGRPGLYDGQVGADEAAGELAATVVWRLEDDGVVVVARGCTGLSAADAGGAEAGRAFTVRELRSLGASWGSGGAQAVKRVFSGEVVAAAGAVAPSRGGRDARVGGVDADLADEEGDGWGRGGGAAAPAAVPLPAAAVAPAGGVPGGGAARGPPPVGLDGGGGGARAPAPPLVGESAGELAGVPAMPPPPSMAVAPAAAAAGVNVPTAAGDGASAVPDGAAAAVSSPQRAGGQWGGSASGVGGLLVVPVAVPEGEARSGGGGGGGGQGDGGGGSGTSSGVYDTGGSGGGDGGDGVDGDSGGGDGGGGWPDGGTAAIARDAAALSADAAGLARDAAAAAATPSGGTAGGGLAAGAPVAAVTAAAPPVPPLPPLGQQPPMGANGGVPTAVAATSGGEPVRALPPGGDSRPPPPRQAVAADGGGGGDDAVAGPRLPSLPLWAQAQHEAGVSAVAAAQAATEAGHRF